MLVCELLEREEDIKFVRCASRRGVSLKSRCRSWDRRSHWFLWITVYLLISSTMMLNSGTLTPPPPKKTTKKQNTRPKTKENYFWLILMHTNLLFSFIYFHVFHFWVICNYFMNIYIFLYYYCFHVCKKCIYVTPLLSCQPEGRLGQNQGRTKALSDQMSTPSLWSVVSSHLLFCFCHLCSSSSTLFSEQPLQQPQNTFPMIPWAYRWLMPLIRVFGH